MAEETKKKKTKNRKRKRTAAVRSFLGLIDGFQLAY